MPKPLSKTRLVSDNRITRMNLDILIDSTKKGIFDSSYAGNIFSEKSVYADTCKFKTCDGKLQYNQFLNYFYCVICDRKQNLQFIRNDKTLRKLDKIDQSVISLREYRVAELEFLSQLLRNLYRITVDNYNTQVSPTEQQIQKAKKIFSKSSDILFSLRTLLSANSGRYDQVVSIVKDGQLLSIDGIEYQVKQTKYRQMLLIGRISEQLTLQNILKLTVSDIPDEPRKKNVNLYKIESKIKELLI